MRLIKLQQRTGTDSVDGATYRDVWINPEHIVSFEPSREDHTLIWLVCDVVSYVVKESPETVKKAAQGELR